MKSLITVLSVVLLFETGLCNSFVQNRKYNALEYLEIQRKFAEIKKRYEIDFQAYYKVQESIFNKYSNSIKKYWPQSEFSTKSKWIEYSEDYRSKKIVDFENKKIVFEVISSDSATARSEFDKLFLELLDDNLKGAYLKDHLEEEILKAIGKVKLEVQSNDKIVSDIFSLNDIEKIQADIKTKELEFKDHDSNKIYTIVLDFPKNGLYKKAKKYADMINKNAQRFSIKPELIYAIIHTESYYNPIGRSNKPSYGLMQIIPQRIGTQGYNYIYKKQGIPIPSYLYKPQNNISIGSAYLHILFYGYLSRVKSENSRLFCVIASYVLGIEGIMKPLNENYYDIEKSIQTINSMHEDEVYRYLVRLLGTIQKENYLKLVMQRAETYANMIEKGEL